MICVLWAANAGVGRGEWRVGQAAVVRALGRGALVFTVIAWRSVSAHIRTLDCGFDEWLA